MSDTPHGSGDPGLSGDPLPPLDPELAAWFASAPAPTMPPDVWTRIEAALAAEPPFTPSGDIPAVPTVASAAPIVDLDERRERKSRSRALPILAGAAGVVLLGAVVIPTMRAGNAPSPVADAPAGEAASATVLSPAGASPSGSGMLATRSKAIPMVMLSTGTDYAPTAMPDQVDALLTTAGITNAATVSDMSSAEPPADMQPVGTEGFTASEDALLDCLDRLGMTAVPPLVVDRATFGGADAGVVVGVKSIPPAEDQPAVLDVVVVGSQCSDEDVAAAQHFDFAVAP